MLKVDIYKYERSKKWQKKKDENKIQYTSLPLSQKWVGRNQKPKKQTEQHRKFSSCMSTTKYSKETKLYINKRQQRDEPKIKNNGDT